MDGYFFHPVNGNLRARKALSAFALRNFANAIATTATVFKLRFSLEAVVPLASPKLAVVGKKPS